MAKGETEMTWPKPIASVLFSVLTAVLCVSCATAPSGEKAEAGKPYLVRDVEQRLTEAGVTLGQNYPAPLVGLTEGRDRALAAFKAMRR